MNNTQDDRGGWTSASQAKADLLCPGRHLAQRGLPEDTSEEAETGSRIHAAVLDESVPLRGEEAEQAQQIRDMRDAYVTKWMEGKTLIQTIAETRMQWADPETGYRHSGKPDFVAVASVPSGALVALVLDYKTGRLPVDKPAVNQQLRDLVVLTNVALENQLQAATCQLIQLWVQTPTPVHYDRPAIERATAEMTQRVRASNDPKSPRIAGEAQCKHCRARTRCPEFSAMVQSVLPQPLTVETAQQAIAQAETALPAISDAKLASVLNVLGSAEKWIAILKSEGRARLRERPGCLPGWKLTPGQLRQTITNIRTVWSRWETRWPGQAETFLGAAKLVKGDLKEAVRDVSGMKGKELAEALNELIVGATTDTVTSPRLVREGEEEEA
jgi:hypothetical protein